MRVADNGPGRQPRTKPHRPRRTIALPLIVERQYQPDPDRCIRAVIALLVWRPSTASSADSTGSTSSRKVVAAEER